MYKFCLRACEQNAIFAHRHTRMNASVFLDGFVFTVSIVVFVISGPAFGLSGLPTTSPQNWEMEHSAHVGVVAFELFAKQTTRGQTRSVFFARCKCRVRVRARRECARHFVAKLMCGGWLFAAKSRSMCVGFNACCALGFCGSRDVCISCILPARLGNIFMHANLFDAETARETVRKHGKPNRNLNQSSTQGEPKGKHKAKP